MKDRVAVKICGIRRAEDAALAAELGVAFLGFIFHPKSPRALDWASFEGLRESLPSVPRVYVQVRPELDELRRAAQEGFDFFQLHFAADERPDVVEKWAQVVSSERLWLAPRIPPGENFPAALLPLARTFLVDTFHREAFGGTGETGDWGRFREWAANHPSKRWILAGGLSPENIVRAVERSGALFVDVNSGIETAPGEKGHERMRALFAALSADPV
jgi:phosphoribosylanthranilate isomerase